MAATNQGQSLASRIGSSIRAVLAHVGNRPPPDRGVRTHVGNSPPAEWPLPPLPAPGSHALERATPDASVPLGVDGRISVVDVLRPERRREIEDRFGIHVAPLKLGGLEIGHMLSKRTRLEHIVLLCARVEHPHDTFDKPPGIKLALAAPRGAVPEHGPLEFAKLLRDGKVALGRSQVCDYGVEEIPNYPLFGIPLQIVRVAQFVGEMARTPGDHDFDVVLINRNAEGVTLSDLLQSIRETKRGEPAGMVCHFARDPRPTPGRGRIPAATLSAR